MLTTFFTDHSPLLFSLVLCKHENRGKGRWKFNKSLNMNSDFVTKMKYHIRSTLETLEKKDITDVQARWEFIEYKTRIFLIIFKATCSQHKFFFLENKKKLGTTTETVETKDKIYEQKINGIRIRTKCDWYKYHEKS